MRTVFDALIVGAGPAGSSAAILLAQAGWSVALIEKQRFPRRKVCGECIAASNLPLLEALGIGPAFEASAGPELRKVALMSGDRMIVADLPPATHQKYRWGRALGRETLDTLLLGQARSAGVHVLHPWSVQAIEGVVGDWRCKARATDSETTMTLRAPVAIAAHGSWEALPTDRSRRRLARNAADDAVEAMLKRECGGMRVALQAGSREGPWLSVGPLDPGIRLRADDDLFRIGNAAGEAHPIIGEGMSMALQSAWLLCAQLIGGERREEMPSEAWQRQVGRRYAAQWRRQFAPRLRLAAVFAYVAMRPASAGLLVALARTWPGFLTLGARWGGKARCAVDPATIALLAPRI